MSLLPYIRIARPDHWFKNIFMVPGVLLVCFFRPSFVEPAMWWNVAAGFVSACLVASSNYVLNEILDAEKDRFHPEKKFRPIPSGEVCVPLAYVEWLALIAAGLGIGFSISAHFGSTAALLWLAAVLYNVPPVRLKDLPYADVLSESLNNPFRLALGWYSTGFGSMPPLSGLLSYWMFGAFLMAVKRYAEYRKINDAPAAEQYRKSFGYYNEERLIESIFFYGALFGMLAGVFMARYDAELVLATPLVALAMAYYIHLGFKPNSAVQYPERLYREKKLMLLAALAFGACVLLLFIRIPAFEKAITPMVVAETLSR